MNQGCFFFKQEERKIQKKEGIFLTIVVFLLLITSDHLIATQKDQTNVHLKQT